MDPGLHISFARDLRRDLDVLLDGMLLRHLLEVRARLWDIATMVQRRCDGVRGTNSDINEYHGELLRFAD